MSLSRMDISKLGNITIIFFLFLSINFYKLEAENIFDQEYIENLVRKINKNIKKFSIIRSYNKFEHREKLQFYNKDILKKIQINCNDGAEYFFKDHYYFYKEELILVEKYIYFFKDFIPENYDLSKSINSIKKIYLKNNMVQKIQIKGNTEILTKKKEFFYIKEDLEEYVYLSKIIKLPNFRIYSGNKNDFYKEYSLTGREKILKLTYRFKQFPCEIIITDHKWNVLYHSKKEITKGKIYKKIKINSHIRKNRKFNEADLQIQINGSPGCKWWLKIEFEGDEIQIG